MAMALNPFTARSRQKARMIPSVTFRKESWRSGDKRLTKERILIVGSFRAMLAR